jgi:CO/xanthine dehydrogenase Mo-binding subunit
MDGVADGGGIGRPVRRLEDLRLLIGKGRYSDDLNLPGQTHALMMRSRHAHARIHSIDIRTAQRTPGTLAVLTGRDFLADGLNPIPFLDRGHPADVSLKNRDGSGPLVPPQLPIAVDEARHVGEIAAIVVAETLAVAKEAAELVAIAWETLTPVAHAVGAARPVAPRARLDVRANIALDAELGDPAAAAVAFARATHIVRLNTQVQRIAACRWSRERRSVNTMRRRAATPSMPGWAVWCDLETISPRFSVSLPTECASLCTMSAAISARAAASTRNSPLSCGRRAESDGQSNGCVSGRRLSCATTRRATSRSRPSWPSTPTAISAETGAVALVQHTAVDDCGRAVNPMILHGQIHGGIAQGVGQALVEDCCYDSRSGQLLAGSFMDYAMPRADLLPFFATELSEVPSPTHPPGIRPAGEGGTTPALGVVVNAVVDALAEFRVMHIEMPLTPERVWRAILAGRREVTP